MQSFELKFLGVTILQGVEFPIFLLIFEWALQQCSATALPVIIIVILPGVDMCCDRFPSLRKCQVIYFLIGLHCRLQLHWVTSEWSCLTASHCIYHSWALCRCHFFCFAQLFRLLTWHLALLQLRDRTSSKSCRQASGRPTGVVAP